MRKASYLISAVLASLLASASPVEAARSAIAPPYTRRIIFNFPTATNGQKMGAIMSVKIVLVNLSAVAQTGKLSLVTGSTTMGSQVGRGLAATQVSLCGSSSASGSSADSVSPVTFTLPANGMTDLMAFVLFSSSYNASGPSGHSQFDAQFTPTLKIDVDQDRGAINGTLTPLWDGPADGGTLCDGTQLSGFLSPLTEEARTGVPLLINGGRPF